jgi:hypothetical protein
MMKKSIIARVAVTAIISIALHASAGVILVDDLADGKSQGSGSGGSFVEQGWKCAGGRMEWKLPKEVTKGGMVVWITDWNPKTDAPGDKYHMVEGRDNNKAGKTSSSFGAFRVGHSNYGTGCKILSIPATLADSHNKKEARASGTWNDPSKVYRLMLIYDGPKIEFHWDDRKLGTHDWSGKIDAMVLLYIVIGKGYYNYPGVNGTIFTKVAAWEGETPANLDALSESGAVAVRRLAPLAASRISISQSESMRAINLLGKKIGFSSRLSPALIIRPNALQQHTGANAMLIMK